MPGRIRSTRDSDLVKVAYAHDEFAAELLQGLLREADKTCCASSTQVSRGHRRGSAPTGGRACSPGC